MKLLALDVDGVLNNVPHIKSLNDDDATFTTKGWDPSCVERIRRVLKETGAKILYSSTWRMDEDWYEVLSSVFDPELIVDKTPERISSDREDDILTWLERNRVSLGVTHIAVVDDWAIRHNGPSRLKDCFVQVIAGWEKSGVEDHHAQDLIRILNGEPNVEKVMSYDR